MEWLWQRSTLGSAHNLQKALSHLRSLSITNCNEADAPALLGALATSCTQLTHLELHLRPWWDPPGDPTPELLRALNQLFTTEAFPALQSLAIKRISFTSFEVRCGATAQCVGGVPALPCAVITTKHSPVTSHTTQ
jgi:hypothetical protein